MPIDRSRPRPPLIMPQEPSLNLIAPPPNLGNSTNIRVGDQIIEITPHNVTTVKQLGQGAYGFVELIRHQPSGIELAVKRISASKVSDQTRLLRDMEVLIRTRGCPDVVEFYGAIYWEDNLCLFMEIMDCSLDKFYKLAYKMFPEPNVVAIPEPVLGRIAFSVVKALHFLHQQRIIHRDVKPSNILINRSGSVKICDFGISGYLVNSVANTFEAGCKAYMAPERLVPNQNGYDIRSDVWSLGLTLFEIATGTFPYPYNDLFRQIKSVYEDDPPRLPPGRYSDHCHHFITKCLEKNHRERPNYVQLLEYPFILTYQNSDISEFTSKILDSAD